MCNQERGERTGASASPWCSRPSVSLSVNSPCPLCSTCFPAQNVPVQELNTCPPRPGHPWSPFASLPPTRGPEEPDGGPLASALGVSAFSSSKRGSDPAQLARLRSHVRGSWTQSAARAPRGPVLAAESFLSLPPPPGTVWNFYFSAFVCEREAWASSRNFHSMRPERESAQVFWGGRRGSREPGAPVFGGRPAVPAFQDRRAPEQSSRTEGPSLCSGGY